jgi:4-amino-4-deoxy-L-arabinose transferase-like glycosyltransferase
LPPVSRSDNVASELTGPLDLSTRRADNAALFAIAAAVTLLHLLTNSRYGFHRDELQFLSDARHMDWGFVAYPPFTALVERIGMALFSLNMVGLRLFSVLAQAAAVIVTGLMARELGGRRLALVTAALAVALSPIPLFEGTEFQYTTFDYLWWVLIAYFTIRLLKSDNPRWWIAIGIAVGLGLETKYAIVFFVAGLLVGLVLTRARRYFINPWFWAGMAVALLIFLPNFIWLVRHDFISYHFLQHIHARDVGEGRADGFIKGQFLGCVNLFAAPLWIVGIVAFLLNPRYRTLAFMYLVPVAFFFFAKGRSYYTAGVYPMLLAMGAATCERWLGFLPRWGRRATQSVFFIGLTAYGALIIAGWVPLASSGPLRTFALNHSGDLREEVGWDELVRTVAQIRDSLPPDQQAHLGITTGNYGEYGAIDILGRAYGLPEPIGTTNSEWLRGYPTQQITTIIALGIRPEEADQLFTNCRIAGHNGNSEGIHNEELDDHPWIFVCGPPRKPWSEVWKEHKDFG